MTARIKNFKTDFTRFLGEKIKHTVQIITKEETLECSGVLLSQHSEVMRKMVEKEEEILLNSYENVKECLLILHGGSVELTEENCEEIIKFGIQFGLTDIVEQGLEYLASHTDEKNLKNSHKICNNANRFAESCNSDANIDYLWPLERTIKNLSETDVKEFVTGIYTTVSIKAVVEMLKNGNLAKKILNAFILLIDQSNILEISTTFGAKFESLYVLAAALSDCPDHDISSFFEKIEALELQKEQQMIFQNLRRCMLLESQTTKIKLKSNYKDLLKKWKQFSEEEIMQVCKVFKTDFFILEVVMSWVTLKKPDLKIVRQLCSLINTVELQRKYLEHAIEVLKTVGYFVSFDLDICKTDYECNIFTNRRHFHDITSYSYCKVPRRQVRVTKFSAFNDSTLNPTGSRYVSNVEYTFDFSENSADDSTKIYGRTVEGKQIPFYTDVEAAVNASTVYDHTTIRTLK